MYCFFPGLKPITSSRQSRCLDWTYKLFGSQKFSFRISPFSVGFTQRVALSIFAFRITIMATIQRSAEVLGRKVPRRVRRKSASPKQGAEESAENVLRAPHLCRSSVSEGTRSTFLALSSAPRLGPALVEALCSCDANLGCNVLLQPKMGIARFQGFRWDQSKRFAQCDVQRRKSSTSVAYLPKRETQAEQYWDTVGGGNKVNLSFAFSLVLQRVGVSRYLDGGKNTTRTVIVTPLFVCVCP